MGLFTSANEGKTWIGGPVLGKTDLVSVQANGELVVAATRGEVLFSTDSGITWKQAVLPANVTVIRGVTVTPDAQIMVASREGAFRSSDTGATWQRMLNGLPDRDISSISYDHSGKGLLGHQYGDQHGVSRATMADKAGRVGRIRVTHFV